MVMKVLAVFLILCPLAAEAAESGVGHYVPGSVATLGDLAPSSPGWAVKGMYLHYAGSASLSLRIPTPAGSTAGLSTSTHALTFGGAYTFETKVLGARYSVATMVPWVWLDVEGSVATPLGTASRANNLSGIGDITIVPAMLAWKSGSWQYDAMIPIYAPTGNYESGRLGNTGLNYWTFDPIVGIAYSNTKIGFNAMMHGGVAINTMNADTDYRSGSTLHIDAAVQQLFPAGPGFIGVGAEVFYLQQVTGDTGSGAFLGDFKGRTVGVGPLLTYIWPLGQQTLLAEVRWLPELEVKNRMEGDYVWFKLGFKL